MATEPHGWFRISVYGLMALAGVAATLATWWRWAREDRRLLFVYIACLAGAFAGAKAVYLAAEGWLHWHDADFWRQLATGKSVLGALAGGYGGVELGKWIVGFRGVTGDRFAAIAPMGILIGRVGCLMEGCCRGIECHPAWYAIRGGDGVARWPSVPVEMAFNAAMLGVFFWLRRTRRIPGQHFHLYLVAYGLFRFAHEFVRDEPSVLGPLSGYQIAALGLAAFGVVAWRVRARSQAVLT
jgi:phosphatidylglycerol:prolipoprotein diacylglycerol transferase